MRKTALPVTLGHDAVVKVFLPVIHESAVTGLTEKEVRQAHHIVNGAVLLILISKAGRKLYVRRPDLAAGLSARGITALAGDSRFPVAFYDLQHLFLAGRPVPGSRSENFRNGRIRMHIGQDIPAFQKAVEEAFPVIPVHQFPEHFLSGQAVQDCPDLQHSAGFHIQNLLKMFSGKTSAPFIKPLREMNRHIQRFCISGLLRHIKQAHESLVYRILRRPDFFPDGNPGHVFFRDGSGPFPAVLFLAFRQDINDLLRLRQNQLISRRLVVHGGGRKPVPQEMAPQFTEREFPSAVNLRLGLRGLIQAGFHQIRERQVLRLQLHHIIQVSFSAPKKLFILQNYRLPMLHFPVCHSFLLFLPHAGFRQLPSFNHSF